MRATFPAGTVCGSPKVRAMQIINQFEKSKRGTLRRRGRLLRLRREPRFLHRPADVVLKESGLRAGRRRVVADSTPEGEYQETVNKAMGMMRAIERAKQIL